MPTEPTPTFDQTLQDPDYRGMLSAVWDLKQAREAGSATPADLTSERQLRLVIDKLTTDTLCNCAGVTRPIDCECGRFEDWYRNRQNLEELGVFPDGVRPPTTLRTTTVGDVTALAEDLLRLVTEGSRGRNFLVASTSFEVYVQFNQFLEPTRDLFIRCEVASSDDLLLPGARERLLSMDFQPPSPKVRDIGQGEDLIIASAENESPNFYMDVPLATDPGPALQALAGITAIVFEFVFGAPAEAPLELELHIEAGVRH